MLKKQLKMTHSPLFLGRLGIWREREKGEVFGIFVVLSPKQKGTASNATSILFEKVTSECRTTWIYFPRHGKWH